jgi:GT2 family glycosyltransferase
MDMYGYPYCRGRILGDVEKDRGQYDTEVDIFWATGACMIIRNAVYKKVGGLDSEFFAHQEEIDLCWRLRSRGYRIVYAPSSVVYHVGGGMLSYESPRKTFLNFRNNLLMLYKNLPENRLNKVMRVRLVLDCMAAVKFFLTGRIANAKAVLEARREYKRMLPSFVSKREENLRLAVTEDIPEMKKTSLLFNYYLGRKRNL